MNLANITLILAGVLLNAAAQLCLKQGMSIIGNVSISIASMIELITRLVMNLYIMSGLVCYVVSFLIWLVVLSRVEVSIAYPALSIGYVIVALVGCFFMHEALGLYKVIGILLICAGTACMFKA